MGFFLFIILRGSSLFAFPADITKKKNSEGKITDEFNPKQLCR